MFLRKKINIYCEILAYYIVYAYLYGIEKQKKKDMKKERQITAQQIINIVRDKNGVLRSELITKVLIPAGCDRSEWKALLEEAEQMGMKSRLVKSQNMDVEHKVSEYYI